MVRFARPALWALQARAVAATTAVQRRGAARAAAAYIIKVTKMQISTSVTPTKLPQQSTLTVKQMKPVKKYQNEYMYIYVY